MRARASRSGVCGEGGSLVYTPVTILPRVLEITCRHFSACGMYLKSQVVISHVALYL